MMLISLRLMDGRESSPGAGRPDGYRGRRGRVADRAGWGHRMASAAAAAAVWQ